MTGKRQWQYRHVQYTSQKTLTENVSIQDDAKKHVAENKSRFNRSIRMQISVTHRSQSRYTPV